MRKNCPLITFFVVSVVFVLGLSHSAHGAWELVKAFAFGAHDMTRATYNEPSVEYVVVLQVGSTVPAYSAAAGYGYTDVDALDDSANDRDIYQSTWNQGDWIYDSFIGIKKDAGTLPMTFRIDVDPGEYRFVAAGGDSDNYNHSTTIRARDGDAGEFILLADNFEPTADGQFWRCEFEDKIVPPASVDPPTFPAAARIECPTLVVTGDYVSVEHDNVGANNSGGDLSLIEVWRKSIAVASDVTINTGERVTLVGEGPADTTSWQWVQISGQEHLEPALQPNATSPEVWFDTPASDVGYMLEFKLTVVSPLEGTGSDIATVYVYAPNAPKVPPANLQVLPMDFGPLGLGFTLRWDPVFDAKRYDLALKLGDQYFWIYGTTETSWEFGGMAAGTEQIVAVRGMNDYPGEGVQSEDVPYTAMPNLALPGGVSDPTDYLSPVVASPIAQLNDKVTDASVDSDDGQAKTVDYWGYLWGEDLFFDHVVYYQGELSGTGGWWTDLTVEFTQDGGQTWIDGPEVTIYPSYNFADSRSGRTAYTRYDISIKAVRGNGIRISGTPGGSDDYTSIGELEVFGNQDQGPLIVYGVDATVDERSVATLDGSYSFSLRGPVSGFQWQQVIVGSEPVVTIADPTQAKTTFFAEGVDEDVLLTFQFTAQDDTESYTDDVFITIKNLKTTAVPGPDQSVIEGGEVALDGSASITTSDSITYSWKQLEGPTGTIVGGDTATPTFTAPFIYQLSVDCVLELQVNDDLGNPDSVHADTVTITVNNRHAPMIVIEAENYTAENDNIDGTSWEVVQGDPTYVTTPDGGLANANWPDGCQLDYDITINTPGTYTIQMRRYSPDGAANSARVGIDGTEVILPEWDNWGNNNVWIWTPGQPITFDAAGDYTLQVQRREDGYRIDRMILYPGSPAAAPAGWSTEIGPPEGNWVGPIFCDRTLGTHYEPGMTLDVDLTFDVNMETPAATLLVTENLPAGFTVASAEGDPDLSTPGRIIWTLTGPDVDNRSLGYTLNVPGDMTGPAEFVGTMSYVSVMNAPIGGDTVVYAIPSAPANLVVEMLAAAHLSWSPSPPEEGIQEYTLYKSADGGAWEEIATVAGTSYVDKWVVAGVNYSYQVSATNVRGFEGPLSPPTEQASLPTMEIREAENFNHSAGSYPGYEDCPAGVESPDGTLGTPQEYDYYHPNTGGPDPAVYRTNDGVPNGIGVQTAEEVDDPGVFHTNIGWIDAGSWWRYTFNVTQPGWIKLSFRVASPSGAMLAAYWDETLIGTTETFVTGNMHIFTWVALEDQVQTTTGEHTLRLEAITDGWNLDKTAIGWDWTPPARKVIWEDPFEAYASTQEVIDNGGWEIINGSTDPDTGDPAPNPNAAWKLWDVDTPLSGDTNIPGMDGNYMVSNSDDSGAGFLLDEELISPEINCANWVKLRLVFNKNYRIYDDPDHQQIAEADIRVFDDVTGWGEWINIFHLDTTSVPAGTDPPMLSGSEQVDLSQYDGKTVQLRWRFYDAEFDYWFAVDDIVLSGEQLAPPKGRITAVTYDGTNVSLTWTAFGDGTYYVEYTTDLTSGVWDTVAGPLTETTWSTEMPGDAVGFARIRSAAP